MDLIFERVHNSFSRQGLMTTLGARLHKALAGEVQIELPFSAHLSQQQGFMHAGGICSVLDSACGYAALTTTPPGFDVVTAEFKINFMRPAVGERFLAIGRVQHAGKTLTVCTGEVQSLNAAGDVIKLIALMQATVATVPG